MKSVIELKISQYVSEITILEKGEENKHYSISSYLIAASKEFRFRKRK